MGRLRRIVKLATASVVAFSSLLTLGFAPLAHASSGSDVCTWTGGGDGISFSDANNWTACSGAAPVDGDSLVFDDTTLPASSATLNNDLTGLSLTGITFQGNNLNFSLLTLEGNDLTLDGTIDNTSLATNMTIDNNIVLAGDTTLSTSSSSILDLEGDISGSGQIDSAGSVFLFGDDSFSGAVAVDSNTLDVGSATALGDSSNVVTVPDGASLAIGSCGDNGFTVANDMVLGGNGADADTQKLIAGALCAGGSGGSADEDYAQAAVNTTQAYTLSGAVTLGSAVTFCGIAQSTTLAGDLNGNYSISLPDSCAGQLLVNSSNNTSGISNGSYAPPPLTVTLSDSQPSSTVYIGSGATVTIDGTRSNTEVASGGMLKGNGTVGALTIDSGGMVAPGHSPGCLSSGNLTLTGTYQVEIGGTDPCTGYDQLKVTGTVDVTNSTLDVSAYNGFSGFKKGQSFTIIDNDGTDAVSGTFSGLPEGATLKLDDGTVLGISYQGGDGNDVVLTVQDVPSTPDTGFGLMAAHPGVTLVVSLLAATTIFSLAQKSRKVSAHH